MVLSYEFVKSIPKELEERTLYVSMHYATVAHKCCCGCGREVITPLSPTDWELTYDGDSISLSPSIGNWSIECRSHYWVHKSIVKWEALWSRSRIKAGRVYDRKAKEAWYARSGKDLQNVGRQTLDNLCNGLRSWLSSLWHR